MLIRRETLEQIARGEVTLAFRRWQRPTVRPGGTLLTRAGQLEIRSVTVVAADSISSEDARLAGYVSQEALLAALERRTRGDIYRVEFGALLPDPRIALRESPLDAAALEYLRRRLARLDGASPTCAWTLDTLRAIRDQPGVRAGDLCHHVGQERARFKPNVRKLKNLGLTISLGVGYRLSPRGEAYLRRMAQE
jgi:hypothetical protein